MNRGAVIAGGVLALALLILLLLGRRGTEHLARQELEENCEQLMPGDSLNSVLARLGPTGFRPGCGPELPCEQVVADGHSFRLSCAQDCSQLWRIDGFSCFVHIDAGDRTLVSSQGVQSPI